jgi:hypothetical protein
MLSRGRCSISVSLAHSEAGRWLITNAQVPEASSRQAMRVTDSRYPRQCLPLTSGVQEKPLVTACGTWQPVCVAQMRPFARKAARAPRDTQMSTLRRILLAASVAGLIAASASSAMASGPCCGWFPAGVYGDYPPPPPLYYAGPLSGATYRHYYASHWGRPHWRHRRVHHVVRAIPPPCPCHW